MLDLCQLEDWKNNVYVCFQTKIEFEGISTEIRYEFAVNFNGKYRILKNGSQIFEGKDILEAKQIYDNCE